MIRLDTMDHGSQNSSPPQHCSYILFQVADSDNAAIEPLIEVLTNIIDPKTFVDMSGSTFKVKLI